MDANKVFVLLSIEEKTRDFPRLKAIREETLHELEEICKELSEESDKKKNPGLWDKSTVHEQPVTRRL